MDEEAIFQLLDENRSVQDTAEAIGKRRENLSRWLNRPSRRKRWLALREKWSKGRQDEAAERKRVRERERYRARQAAEGKPVRRVKP